MYSRAANVAALIVCSALHLGTEAVVDGRVQPSHDPTRHQPDETRNTFKKARTRRCGRIAARRG